MDHNFDFLSIKAYQEKIVGEINSQIGTLESEQSSLTQKQSDLSSRKSDLTRQLSSLSSSSSSDSSEAAQKAMQIAAISAQLEAIETQLTAIASRLSAIEAQKTTLKGAITETDAFVTGLDARINNTDLTYAAKIREINEAIQTYTNNMKNLTSILYPPSKETIPILGVLSNQTQNMKTIGFMNILANMTETSYGYTMVGCINKNIDGRISNAEIAKATKEALAIDGLRDASQLLAWAQTLGMASSQDIVSLISDGTLNYMGIKPDQAVAYRGDGKNVSLRESSGDSVLPYEKNLAKCLEQVYNLPHQAPTTGAIGTDLDEYPNHRGIDYPVNSNTDVWATTTGIVSGTRTGLSRAEGNMQISEGNYVTVVDKDGNTHHYAHLTAPSVETGELVLPGEKIGTSGNSGNTSGITGNHLHYEVQPEGSNWGSGNRLDPNDFIG